MPKKVDDSGAELVAGRYLGVLCRKRHEYRDSGQSVRSSTKHCVMCARLLARNYYRANQDVERPRATDRRNRNLAKYRATEARKRDRTRAQIRKASSEYHKRARRENPQHASEVCRRYYRANSLRIRLRSRLFKAMSMFSRTGKTKSADEYGVDYGAIIRFLGASPGPASEWHIDHIRPLASFDFNDPEQVREAFAPRNHQWLAARENLEKSSKWA